MDNNITTISIRESTKERLFKFKKFKEDWDVLLNRIMDSFEVGNG